MPARQSRRATAWARPLAPAEWQAPPVPEPAARLGAPARAAASVAKRPRRGSPCVTGAADVDSSPRSTMVIVGELWPSSITCLVFDCATKSARPCVSSITLAADSSACLVRAVANSACSAAFASAAPSAASMLTADAPRRCNSAARRCISSAAASRSSTAFSSASLSFSESAESWSRSALPPAPDCSRTCSLCKFLYTSSAAAWPLTMVTSAPSTRMPRPILAAAVSWSTASSKRRPSLIWHSMSTRRVFSNPFAAETLRTVTSPSSAPSTPSTGPEAVESPNSSISNPVMMSIFLTVTLMSTHGYVDMRAPITTCGLASPEMRW